MVLQPLNGHGWTIDDGHLTIDWDSMENIKAIQDRVSLLTKKDASAKQVALLLAVGVKRRE